MSIGKRVTAAHETMLAVSDPNFDRFGMAKKMDGAGRKSIRARLKYRKKIADFGVRQGYVAREGVERGTQRSDDINRFLRLAVYLADDGDRIVSFYGLAEIAGSSEMVVHAAIENEKLLPSR